MVRGDVEADAGGGDRSRGCRDPVSARQPGLGVLRLPWETQCRMAGLRAHRFPYPLLWLPDDGLRKEGSSWALEKRRGSGSEGIAFLSHLQEAALSEAN